MVNKAGTVLLSLIRQRAWNKVLKILSFNPKLAQPCESSCRENCTQLHSPLLLACKLNPPLDVVNSLLQAYPDASVETDCENKLPLHVACEFGAHPAVINTLLKANIDAAMEKDIFGMLPIHRVCDSYLYNFDIGSTKMDPQYSVIETISILLGAQPTALLVDDNKEMCPIEYAIESNLSLAVIRILQKVSQRELLKKEMNIKNTSEHGKRRYYSRAA